MIFLRLFLLSMVLVLTGRVEAEGSSPFEVHKIRENVYVLTRLWEPGIGNNMGVVVGEDGLLLINSMMASDSEALSAALKGLSDKPVKYVINSNWDPYNVQGNAYFAAEGATIVAQQDIRYAPRDTSYAPVVHQLLFEDMIAVHLGNETVLAERSGGHSFPHVNVSLVRANVVFMADSFRPDWFGVMGPYGLKGYLAGLDQALRYSNDETIFISGTYDGSAEHGRADLLREKAIRQAFVARIGALNRKGKTVDEMLWDEGLRQIVGENFPAAMKRFGGLQAYDILPTLTTEFMASPDMPLETYVGSYISGSGLALDVYLEGGALFAQSLGRFKAKLIPVSATDFILAGAQNGEKVVFELDTAGAAIAVRPEMGDSYMARRMPAGMWQRAQ